MRTNEEVKQKLNELYQKKLKLRIKKYLKRSFINCKFNERVLLEKGQFKAKIGCCNNPILNDKNKQFNICNEENKAIHCKYYQCKHDKKEIEDQFIKEISEPKICGQREPKIAILMWFLQQNNLEEIKTINWIKRLWQKMFH